MDGRAAGLGPYHNVEVVPEDPVPASAEVIPEIRLILIKHSILMIDA